MPTPTNKILEISIKISDVWDGTLKVHLQKIFENFEVYAAEEFYLGGDYEKSAFDRLEFRILPQGDAQISLPTETDDCKLENLCCSIFPTQIKTLVLSIKHS